MMRQWEHEQRPLDVRRRAARQGIKLQPDVVVKLKRGESRSILQRHHAEWCVMQDKVVVVSGA